MVEEFSSENEIINNESAGLVYAFAAAPGFMPGQSGVVFAGCSDGLKRSADGGRTWQDALAELNLSEPLPVTSLVVSPDYDGKEGRIIGGAPGGVFTSPDGLAWKAVLLPSPPPTVTTLTISADFAHDATVFAGTMEDGVFVSQEQGERWVAWNFGLLDLNVMCLAISPSFSADETIFAGTETGIFRSTNGGRAWREIEPPFGYEAVLSLALSPRYAEDHTLYAGTESQGLWVSKDEGDTWQRLADEMIDDPINAILLSEKDGLLAVTSTAFGHSADGGAPWENRLPPVVADREVSTVIAPQGFAAGARVLAGFTGGSIETITLV